MDTSSTTTSLLTALMEVQGQLQPIVADATNSYTNSVFTSLPAILKAVQPMLNERGILVQFYGTQAEDMRSMTVFLRMTHVPTGEWCQESLRFSTPSASPHEIGSAASYGRRYLLLMALNLVTPDGDDDGNGAQLSHHSHSNQHLSRVSAAIPRGDRQATTATTASRSSTRTTTDGGSARPADRPGERPAERSPATQTASTATRPTTANTTGPHATTRGTTPPPSLTDLYQAYRHAQTRVGRDGAAAALERGLGSGIRTPRDVPADQMAAAIAALTNA